MGPRTDPKGIFTQKSREVQLLVSAISSAGGGPTAARLAESGDIVSLLHSGKVNATLNKPFIKEQIRINGQKYYEIGDINDRSFFLRLVRFHRSRYRTSS